MKAHAARLRGVLWQAPTEWLKRHSIFDRVVAGLVVAAIPSLGAMLWSIITVKPPSRSLMLTGFVADPVNCPVSEARIAARNGAADTWSGRDGTFSLQLADAEIGDALDLRAEHPDFAAAEVHHVLEAGLPLSIVLDPPPVPGAVVRICCWNADLEEITLCNRGDSPAEIAGWTLTDGEGEYEIPAQTELLPRTAHKLGRDQYNPTGNPGGLMLNNQHDQIRLLDRERRIVHEVAW